MSRGETAHGELALAANFTAQWPAMILLPRQPFSFLHTLRFILSPPALLNGRQFAPLLDYFVGGEYRRAVQLDERRVLYGVREERERGEARLGVRILAGPDDEATHAAVRSLVERQFSTQLDLAPFYRLAARDPVLSRLTEHFRGMRIPQAPTVFETLVSAILEQQVNLSFAHQVKKALIEAFGEPVEFEGRRYLTFPQPASLAIATPRQLRRLQISGPKARYLIGLARTVLDGTVDAEGLRERDPAFAYAKLRELKGVGPWTVQYVGLRALGHLDCLPAEDVGLQKAVMRFYGLRKQPGPVRLERLARAWAGWRSYATFYLWLTYWEDTAWRENFERSVRQKARAAVR